MDLFPGLPEYAFVGLEAVEVHLVPAAGEELLVPDDLVAEAALLLLALEPGLLLADQPACAEADPLEAEAGLAEHPAGSPAEGRAAAPAVGAEAPAPALPAQEDQQHEQLQVGQRQHRVVGVAREPVLAAVLAGLAQPALQPPRLEDQVRQEQPLEECFFCLEIEHVQHQVVADHLELELEGGVGQHL